MTGFARDFAPEQKRDGKRYQIGDRSYLPADPELDGKALPTGFSVAINPTYFTNKITQVGVERPGQGPDHHRKISSTPSRPESGKNASSS